MLYNTYANYDEYLLVKILNNMLRDKSKELVSYVPVDAKRVKLTNNRIAIN